MEAIIAAVIQAMIGPIADKVLQWHQDDNKTSISKEQITSELKKVAMSAATQWWASSNDATVKTFDSFQQTLRITKTARVVWAYFMVSQITFIVWLELGIPFLAWKWEVHYPGVGSLDTWAMAAVLACLGLGPLVLKHSQPEVPKV